jgi:hypothetical protein
VRVAPLGKRAWRNSGDDALVFLVIQARVGTLDQSNISDGKMVPGRVVWKTTAAECSARAVDRDGEHHLADHKSYHSPVAGRDAGRRNQANIPPSRFSLS